MNHILEGGACRDHAAGMSRAQTEVTSATITSHLVSKMS